MRPPCTREVAPHPKAARAARERWLPEALYEHRALVASSDKRGVRSKHDQYRLAGAIRAQRPRSGDRRRPSQLKPIRPQSRISNAASRHEAAAACVGARLLGRQAAATAVEASAAFKLLAHARRRPGMVRSRERPWVKPSFGTSHRDSGARRPRCGFVAAGCSARRSYPAHELRAGGLRAYPSSSVTWTSVSTSPSGP